MSRHARIPVTVGAIFGAGLILAAIIVGTALLFAGVATQPAGYTVEPVTTTLQEDDMGWDCRTMGNQSCGVVINGSSYVLDFSTGTFTER